MIKFKILFTGFLTGNYLIMKFISFFFVFAALLLPALPGISQDSSLIILNHEIDQLKKDKSLEGTSWGLCVINTSTRDVITEYNSSLRLLPASTLKLITSGTAMFVLGPDYRYKTSLLYDGSIDKSGKLNGNLYIRGSGDPSFGSFRYFGATSLDSIFKTWLRVLKEKKIRQVNGTVIADPDIFDDRLVGATWFWDDLGNYYGSGASGLNVFENMYYVSFRPGKNIGDPAPVTAIEPDIPGLNYINRVTTAAAGTGDNVYIYGSPYSYIRFFEGTVPLGNDFPVRGSMPDPAFNASYLFYKYLLKNGIEVCNWPSTTVLDRFAGITHAQPSKLLDTWQSPQLYEMINRLNYWSINLYADCLTKTLGSVINHYGSYSSGVNAITSFLSGKVMPLTGLNMADGSGLSHLNRISPYLQAAILASFTTERQFEAFYNSIPVAGQSGTMTYILKGTPAEGKIRAKSGGLEDVKAYTGYVKNRKGELLSFSIIFNSFNMPESQLQEKIDLLMLRISAL